MAQGSVLSSLLFTLFPHPLNCLLTNSTLIPYYKLHIDDAELFISLIVPPFKLAFRKEIVGYIKHNQADDYLDRMAQEIRSQGHESDVYL